MFSVFVICALFELSLSTTTSTQTTPSILTNNTETNYTEINNTEINNTETNNTEGGLSKNVIQIIVILVVCSIAVCLSYYCAHKEEQKDLNRLRDRDRQIERDVHLRHDNIYNNYRFKQNPAFVEAEEETQMEYRNGIVIFDTSEATV